MTERETARVNYLHDELRNIYNELDEYPAARARARAIPMHWNSRKDRKATKLAEELLNSPLVQQQIEREVQRRVREAENNHRSVDIGQVDYNRRKYGTRSHKNL